MSEYDHPPCCDMCASAQGACSDCMNTGHPHPPTNPALNEHRVTTEEEA